MDLRDLKKEVQEANSKNNTRHEENLKALGNLSACVANINGKLNNIGK